MLLLWYFETTRWIYFSNGTELISTPAGTELEVLEKIFLRDTFERVEIPGVFIPRYFHAKILSRSRRRLRKYETGRVSVQSAKVRACFLPTPMKNWDSKSSAREPLTFPLSTVLCLIRWYICLNAGHVTYRSAITCPVTIELLTNSIFNPLRFWTATPWNIYKKVFQEYSSFSVIGNIPVTRVHHSGWEGERVELQIISKSRKTDRFQTINSETLNVNELVNRREIMFRWK